MFSKRITTSKDSRVILRGGDFHRWIYKELIMKKKRGIRGIRGLGKTLDSFIEEGSRNGKGKERKITFKLDQGPII